LLFNAAGNDPDGSTACDPVLSGNGCCHAKTID